MNGPASICLVRLSALGDVVLALPLVETLRRAFPTASLTWVISPESHALLEGLPGVEFLVVPKPRGLGDYARFWRRMRGRRFDVVLAAQASYRANFLQALIPARRRIGFDAERARDFHGWFVRERIRPRREHLLEGFLAFAEALGVHARAPRDRVAVAVARERAAACCRRSRSWSFIPPRANPSGPGGAERYAALAREIVRERGLAVVLTGGPAEAERAMAVAVAEQAGVAIHDLVGRTTPKQLALVIQQARAVVSPDTAAVHLGRAVGTPVVGLYAVARPEMTGPYRQLEYCVNAFPRAVRTILGKDPETCAWNTRVPFPAAMDLIAVEEVWEKLTQALAAAR